jgi:hypothetical protein
MKNRTNPSVPAILGRIAILLTVPGLLSAYSPEKYARTDPGPDSCQNVRIVFWNVENLYDPYDDSTTLDDEFTAAGARHWSYSKFRTKLNHLSKVLLAIGNWEPPPIVGLCEVENRYVLNKLIYDSPLKKFRYRVVHHDSPDRRGVDVAMLYRPDRFRLIGAQARSIRFPFDTTAETREILMVKGVVNSTDTLILFVNHWPSRRGGELASRPRRNWVAGILRAMTDSLLGSNPSSAIVIMGDFNDEPVDLSLTTHLKARLDTINLQPTDLVNLMAPKYRREGTHKYHDAWGILDQFIVSAALARGKPGLAASYGDAHIYRGNFLLTGDAAYLGEKPVRTFNGPKYLGGFSDHLPVYLDLRR